MPNPPRNIEMVAFPGMQMLDVTGPLQVFASANDFTRLRGLPEPYTLSLVGSASPTVMSSGLALVTQPWPDDAKPVDTLIVPGGEGVDNAMRDADFIALVRRRAGFARRTVSVCSGAFLLAEAGLLNGKSAATHWARCGELARRFPDVDVLSNPIFVRDGQIWTSAGVTAGIDLCLALVEQDIGRSIALEIARDLVLFLKRSGGQAQYSAALDFQHNERFEQLHVWVQDHLRDDLSVPSLAARCGMSERNFSRRYTQDLGITPARGVERLRVEVARRMLAETDMPAKVIAKQCGFKSEEVLRRSFVRILSISPREYRRNWRERNQQ